MYFRKKIRRLPLKIENSLFHSMITVIGMGVVVDAAGTEIPKMGGNNEGHGHQYHPLMLGGHELLGDKKSKSYGENSDGDQAVVMLFVPVPQGIYPNDKG
jgi:hypothetical protein